MAHCFHRYCVGGDLFALIGLSVAALQAGGRDDPVKVAVKAGKADSAGKQKVSLTLTIDDGWYIYANPVGDEDFEGNKVQVKAKGATIKVTYPPGKVKTDKLGDKEVKYNIHKGQAEIQLELQRAADTEAPELTLLYNACNLKGQCLPQKKVKLKID